MDENRRKQFAIDFLRIQKKIPTLAGEIYILKNQRWEALKKLRGIFQPREYKILTMRFHDGMLLEMVARKFDVTRERIRQLEEQALEKIKARAN